METHSQIRLRSSLVDGRAASLPSAIERRNLVHPAISWAVRSFFNEFLDEEDEEDEVDLWLKHTVVEQEGYKQRTSNVLCNNFDGILTSAE